MAEDLKTQAARIKAEMLKHIADRQAAVALTLSDKLIGQFEGIATPKKTGHARNNWIISVGVKFEGVDGSPESPSTAEQDAGYAALAGYGQRVSRASQLQTLYLTNNVPYIERLNAGSSQQAPAAFVESDIEQTLVEVDEHADSEIAVLLRKGSGE